MAYKKSPLTGDRLVKHQEQWVKRAIFNRARSDLLDVAGLGKRDKKQGRCAYLVFRAVKAGLLPRLSGGIKCSDCCKPAAVYDHRSYARPLDVQPVCSRCNLLRGHAEDSVAKARRELYVRAGLGSIRHFHATSHQITERLTMPVKAVKPLRKAADRRVK